MNFSWLTWSNPITFWWIFLVSVSVVNILAWVWTRTFVKRREIEDYRLRSRAVVLCSAAYVFGCAFRSFLPRADVQRITLFDTWFASVFVGRSVATIAELAFVVQWAIVISFISKATKSNLAGLIAKIIVPMIFVAEVCSWYAVISTNYFGNVIEESLWAATYTLIAVSLLAILPKLNGALKYAVGIAIGACAVYVGFMATVDVPMYVSRWLEDTQGGKEYLGLFQGIIDLNTRWVVTYDISEWKTEIPWMSLYFSFAVWVSLALCYVPLSERRLGRHLAVARR